MKVKGTDTVDGTEGVVDRYERPIALAGRDPDTVFRELEDRLLRYDIFPRRQLQPEVCSDDGRLRDGTTIVQHVAIGPLELEAAVRVVRLWRNKDGTSAETGFTYATLEGHPERGVSTFRLRRSPQGSLTFTIEARSRPGSVLTKLARPFARRFQRRATLAALTYFTDLRRS
jgi:uncharacterized protein (UPF0548 family)